MWAFCGDEPHKNCSQSFLKFWKKILSQKKSKKFFFDFGSKNYSDQCNLVSGVREHSFFDQKLIFKIFDFWLRKISKFFEKILEFFSTFISNFSNFCPFFAIFYNLRQLLTHLELCWTLQNMSSVIGWGDKRFQKSTKIQLFRTNFPE